MHKSLEPLQIKIGPMLQREECSFISNIEWIALIINERQTCGASGNEDDKQQDDRECGLSHDRL